MKAASLLADEDGGQEVSNKNDTLARSQINDTHFLKSVTNLGDVRPVIASQDIHSQTGVKLLNAGMRIDSTLYERLLQHKLITPIEQSLSTESSVTGSSLAEIATQMLKEDERLALIQSAHWEGQTLPQILQRVTLNPAIAFKLTVMRETNAELFRNSVYVSLVSTYIGMQLEMERHQLIDIATAALLHDIGLLHIDPKLLERDHKMTETERRHLYVHSITGWMTLSAYPEYKKKVLDGVLQHHERLDGSGYPRGLKAGEIGLIGQIIAVSEIIASRFGGQQVEHSWARLETILKLNLRRYGSELVSYLKVFYQKEGEPPSCSDTEKQDAQDKMSLISRIFAAWENARDKFGSKDPIGSFINERMMDLKIEVHDAGLNLNSQGNNLLSTEDLRACFETRILLDEALWQLRSIKREIRRRWPTIDSDESSHDSAAASAWIKEAEALL